MKTTCRKKAVIGIALGLAILLTGGAVLHANLGSNCGGPGFSKPAEHIAMVCAYLTKRLDLDANQQQQLDVIAQDLLIRGKNLQNLRTTARQEVVNILRADSVDMPTVQRLQAQHVEELDGFIKDAGNLLVEFVNVLTPEQRLRLAGLIEDHASNGSCSLTH
jgi:Spy/CpxP family protein refolding chaperone